MLQLGLEPVMVLATQRLKVFPVVLGPVEWRSKWHDVVNILSRTGLISFLLTKSAKRVLPTKANGEAIPLGIILSAPRVPVSLGAGGGYATNRRELPAPEHWNIVRYGVTPGGLN